VESDNLLLPDLSLEPLEILKRYEGGYGYVYIVRDSLRQEYALKTPKLDAGISSSELLKEALKHVGIPHHRNILSPTGISSYQGNSYIIMPAMRGNLREVLDKPLSSKRKVDLITEIASALFHLHSACNILHLDLKPENILFDSDMQCRLSDFGLSAVLPSRREWGEVKNHEDSSLAGTATYMSPEHFASMKLSDKSDIFSFGVIMFEILAGRYPFITSSLQDLARSILYSKPEFTMSERLRIPQKLKNICRLCLQKSPQNRPSAEDILRLLKADSTRLPRLEDFNINDILSKADILVNTRNHAEARLLLDKVLALNPYHFVALSLYATLEFNDANQDRAADYAESAMSAAIWSNEPRANLEKALLNLSYYYLSIDPLKAVKYGLRAVELLPNDWQAMGNIAEACRVYGDSKSDQFLLSSGLTFCTKAIELAPGDLKLELTYCGILLAQKNFHDLQPRLVNLVNKHAESDPHVRFLYIRTLIATGNHSSAMEWLEPMRQFQELNPMVLQAERELGEHQSQKRS
jgi:tRNA A-37 threonylcarbamoyl transferase component Bud32/tetratricopeptide (TPR) repeat protein